MMLRINGGNHGKDSDSEQQAEKHNLCSLVTEQANAGSRQIQRGGASEHSHRAKKIAAVRSKRPRRQAPFRPLCACEDVA